MLRRESKGGVASPFGLVFSRLFEDAGVAVALQNQVISNCAAFAAGA
jgi:hypothetical protein